VTRDDLGRLVVEEASGRADAPRVADIAEVVVRR
jgi:hypothetical protein